MQFSPNDRHILVITGEHKESVAYAKEISRELDAVEYIHQKKAQVFLGQELDAVIFDMHQGFDANAFGAISGTIRGGGFLILLRPHKLPKNSFFLKRFNRILKSTTACMLLASADAEKLILPKPPRKDFSDVFATQDQEKAVAAIIKVITGHRRRPLVITSDRGRGKSAALGIAAAKLIHQGIKKIIVCAPSKKTVEAVFKHAELCLDNDIESTNYTKINFYSPDELQQQKPKADLVLIDEAAAIPIPMLSDFLRYYSRIVFSSTQHGYEGCGRGFAINFKKVLDQQAPQWKSCELKTPIRWRENDSLEAFTFDALLLDAEAVDPTLIENFTLKDCQFSQLDKQELLTNDAQLKQLFGLLVSAHYQTKPSDLMQLLDDDSVSIFCLAANTQMLAVALVIAEGNIEPALTADIFSGKRRLQGHLVAQALSSNIGIETAPQLAGERISRIAVHQNLQDQGLGSYLIQQLIDRSSADYLSTSFGATAPLLSFWQKTGFVAVHLGIKRDASSGAHSVTMLRAINHKGLTLSEQAQSIFAKNFPHLLTDVLSQLESEIVFALLPETKKRQSNNFSTMENNTLNAFAQDLRGYENSLFLIYGLVLSKLKSDKKLNNLERKILIMKVLQKQTWQTVVTKMDAEISGKKQALALIRQAIAKLL